MVLKLARQTYGSPEAQGWSEIWVQSTRQGRNHLSPERRRKGRRNNLSRLARAMQVTDAMMPVRHHCLSPRRPLRRMGSCRLLIVFPQWAAMSRRALVQTVLRRGSHRTAGCLLEATIVHSVRQTDISSGFACASPMIGANASRRRRSEVGKTAFSHHHESLNANSALELNNFKLVGARSSCEQGGVF